MKIQSISGEFQPTNFEILDFYGEENCFLWQNDKIALFPYNIDGLTVTVLPIIAPKLIKSIHSYLGRIFVTCKPSGIFKFTKSRVFALLSKSGFAIGSEYFIVLRLQDNCLFFENKRDNKIKELLLYSNSSNQKIEESSLNFLRLTSKFTHKKLQDVLFPDQDSICLISSNRTFFKLSYDVIQIIHECLCDIIEIIPIKKDNLILGLFLKTNSTFATFVHVINNELIFKKIHFNIEINSLCAGFLIDSEEIISIIYSDKEKIYFARQNIHLDSLYKISWRREKILDCKNYKDKVIALNSTFNLDEITCNVIESESISRNREACKKIRTEMLTGSEVIVENICEGAKELDELNKKFIQEKDKLYRINIFTNNQKIPCVPKIKVDRSGHLISLKVLFEYNLPLGSYITVNVTSKKQTTFSSQLVKDNETMLEVLLKPEFLDSSINVNFDLVTFAEENKPWFVVNDFLKEPGSKEKQKVKDCLNYKTNFLNTKLNVLKNLIQQDNQIDEKKLSNIKKSLRREIPDF